MAAEAGESTARVGAVVAAFFALAALGAGGSAETAREPAAEPLLAQLPASMEADPAALKALAARVRQAAAPVESARAPAAEAAAPLPGPEWTDPDSVNWADAPVVDRGPLRDRLLERRGDRGPPPGGRLLERLRGELRAAALGGRTVGDVVTPGGPRATGAGWPEPAALRDQLTRLASAHAPAAAWATTTLAHLDAALATGGPDDPAAAVALLSLGEDVDAGMALADRIADAPLAASVRRVALAVARRVAVWRAAAAPGAAAGGGRDAAAMIAADVPASPIGLLLETLEGFESSPGPAAAARVRAAIDSLDSSRAAPAAAVGRAVVEHYMAPNLRVAVNRDFLERLLPEATVTSGPLQDVVMGRPVRGTRRVEQSVSLRLVPDPDEIRAEMVVAGVVSSRTVTESGPIALHSRGNGEFTVRKPLTISAAGLSFGRAVGTARNRARLADIRSDFDAVPIMGPLMRSIARNQHDEHRAEAMREVNDKVVARACREVDANAEPKFREAADRFRKRVWDPLVGLGLEPRVVALETTADAATARIQLAGAGQLAAHTPRPRPPADALLGVQVHESSVNNACERLGLAGRRFTLEELVRTVCGRLGLPPRIPDDLPGDVAVEFAEEEPLRIECRDGLVHVRMAIDAIESDRRAWYDIVAQVAYRPVISGPQVQLERDGPVRLSGDGQQGRIEVALRTIFGKIFPKERPAQLLPAEFTRDPRMAGIQPVQAVSTDGWFALALAQPAPAAARPAAPTANRPAQPARRMTRR